MGCCLSTSQINQKSPHKHHHSPGSIATGESRAPPPPPSVEEETVKEVLSETHRPKPSPSRSQSPNPKSKLEEDAEKKQIPKPEPVLFPIIKLNDEKFNNTTPFYLNAAAPAEEEISEVSEICSLSESVSATTTITRDDDEELEPRVYRSPMKLTNKNNRSLAGDLGSTRRERAVGKSPTRRSNHSPGRINGVGWGQTMSRRGLRMMDLQQQQQQQLRRDWCSGSDRRSRSPATNRTDNGVNRPGVGRSPAARRSVRSPGRAALGPNPNYGNNQRREAEDNRVEEGKWPPPNTRTTTDESLENPLVSLECFIFL